MAASISEKVPPRMSKTARNWRIDAKESANNEKN